MRFATLARGAQRHPLTAQAGAAWVAPSLSEILAGLATACTAQGGFEMFLDRIEGRA